MGAPGRHPMRPGILHLFPAEPGDSGEGTAPVSVRALTVERSPARSRNVPGQSYSLRAGRILRPIRQPGPLLTYQRAGRFLFKFVLEFFVFGRIANVVSERGYGFITIDGERKSTVFFHKSALVDFVWSAALIGQRVEFDLVHQSDRGPQASSVRPVEISE